MTKIKICGITNLQDALAAQRLKAEALGFVFYPASPRYIKPLIAREIILNLNKTIKKVGVFVNSSQAYCKMVARLCGLDMLQFHGLETPEFCAGFTNFKIIKAFRLKDKNSLKQISRYNAVDYYLFDAFKKGSPGGTGKSFKWDLLKKVKIPRPFFVSGGLNPDNVVSVIKQLSPDWVDASSGLEESTGKKGVFLLKKFIERVKNYEGKAAYKLS